MARFENTVEYFINRISYLKLKGPKSIVEIHVQARIDFLLCL